MTNAKRCPGRGSVQPSDKGALTQVYLGGVTFELVVSK